MKRTPLLLLVGIVILALAAACGGSSKPSPTNTPSDSPSIKDTPVTSTSAAEPTATAGSGDSGPVSNEPVAFQTPDGVTVHGHLYAIAGPKKQIVILSHDVDGDQTDWTPFAKQLALQGIAALTFDFRGYGETGGSKDDSKIDGELDTAVLLLQSRDYPSIYLVGAGMGGTAALKVAAHEDVAGVITLSAPPSIQGLDASGDIATITAPKLFIAAKDDSDAAGAVQSFMNAAQEPKQSLLVDGSAHGIALLQGSTADQVTQAILDFITQ